jgi:hypothetical protein
MLKVGNRTVGVGKGGLEMGDNLGRRSARCSGLIGRRTTCRQCRAELALAEVESFPDALPGPVTSPAVGDDTACRGNTAGNGALQESPQRVGGHAQASDFIGEPDAEGATTAGTPMAVAAKDPPSAESLVLRVAFVVSAQSAVPDQRANRFAMRTRRLLETFRKRVPFLLATAKPALLAHVRPTLRENR